MLHLSNDIVSTNFVNKDIIYTTTYLVVYNEFVNNDIVYTNFINSDMICTNFQTYVMLFLSIIRINVF